MSNEKKSVPLSPGGPAARRFVKDVKGVCGVWGLRLYDQVAKRKAQLEGVRGVMSASDFPKRQRNGFWERAAVGQWGELNLVLSKDKRSFELNTEGQGPVTGSARVQGSGGKAGGCSQNIGNVGGGSAAKDLKDERDGKDADGKARAFVEEVVAGHSPPAIVGGLPVQDKPAQDGELFVDEAPEVKLNRRLDRLELMYFNPPTLPGDPKIQKWEVDELRKHRPWLWSGAAKASPVKVDDYVSQAEFSRIVSELYNVPVYPMQVSRALNEEGMPGRMQNQSIKTSLALPWWEENKVRKQLDGQGSLFQKASQAELQKKIDDGRRAGIEADEAERSMSNKWVLRSTAQASVSGALKLYHGFVKRELERGLGAAIVADCRAQLIDENLLPLIAAAAARAGRGVIKAVEEECDHAAHGGDLTKAKG